MRVPNKKEIVDAFKAIETHGVVPNAIYCAVCGQGINFKTKEGALCNHLRQDFGMSLLPEEKLPCSI